MLALLAKYVLAPLAGLVIGATGMRLGATVCYPYQGCTGSGTPPSAGQVLIGNSSSTYTAANLTAGSGVTIATSSGAITISATSSGDWTGTFDGQEGAWYRDRANHTGTQTAATISDFDAQARTVWNQTLYATSSPTFASGTIGPVVITDTLPSTASQFIHLTGTLPATAVNSHYGFRADITTAGSDAQIQAGLLMNLAAGYTGSARTIGLQFANAVAGTGGSFNSSGLTVPNGNSGFAGQANASTTGYNYGGSGYANSGAVNIGLIGRALSNNVGANVGILGTAGGTSPATRTGGFFGTIPSGTEPTLENAGLIADNGNFAAPIFLARDNQTTVFTIADGGAVGIGTTPGEQLHVKNDQNTDTDIVVENTNGGTTAYSSFEARNGTSVNDAFRAGVLGTGYSSSGGYIADNAFFAAESNLAGLSIIARNGSAPIRFYTGGFADGNERIRITSTGNVGVGTSTPQAKFHVTGTASSTAMIGTNNSVIGCLAMADTDGAGMTYITASNGVLSATTTKPTHCS